MFRLLYQILLAPFILSLLLVFLAPILFSASCVLEDEAFDRLVERSLLLISEIE